jgi:hypothetical protein
MSAAISARVARNERDDKRKAKRAARPPKGEGRKRRRARYWSSGQCVLNKKKRAAKRAKALQRAKRPAHVARVAAKRAGKHAQRHGMHLQSILRNNGLESYQIALAGRAQCELCRKAAE